LRKIKARSWQYFFSAAILTALVIAFAAALIFAEVNTSGTGIREVSVPFSVSLNGEGAALTVNDRAYEIPLSGLYEFLQSRFLGAFVTIWFLL